MKFLHLSNISGDVETTTATCCASFQGYILSLAVSHLIACSICDAYKYAGKARKVYASLTQSLSAVREIR